MFSAKKILVPVDFSDVSRAAISAALQMAAASSGEVWLLHVERGLESDMAEAIQTAPNETVIENQIRFDEHALTEAAALEAQRCAEAGKPLPFVPVHVRVTGGSWLEVAIDMISELQLDLVITGTHGRKGVAGFLMGSVSERLAGKAPCSVFVVKPQGFPYLRD
ncbi:MAG TPA: universal stress protein [Myxococcota bacterium]|nr:universal stress protein [Myxococcota bacterium]